MALESGASGATLGSRDGSAAPDRACGGAGRVSAKGEVPARAEPAREQEAELARRLKAREPGAFEELVRGYGPRMLAVVRRFFSREADAEDALQDAFLNVFRSIGGFAGQSRLSTWLHRVAVTSALMRIRARKRRPEVSIDELSGEAASEITGPGLSLPAHDAVAREELRDRVRSSLRRLPEENQAVLRLHDIQGLDLRETADLLGISLTTVKTRLYSGRQVLRGFLVASIGASP